VSGRRIPQRTPAGIPRPNRSGHFFEAQLAGGCRGSSNNGTASGDSGLRVARPAHGTRLTRWPAWAAQAEVLLRQALEIFQRIGAAEAPDILAELGALTAPDPYGKPKHHAGRAR